MIVLKWEGKTYVPAYDHEEGAFEWISNPAPGTWRDIGEDALLGAWREDKRDEMVCLLCGSPASMSPDGRWRHAACEAKAPAERCPHFGYPIDVVKAA